MYLVVLRHHMDDLPLLLTSGEQEAFEFARQTGPDDGEDIKRLLSIDADSATCVCVYEFRNGQFVKWTRVKDFTDDTEMEGTDEQ